LFVVDPVRPLFEMEAAQVSLDEVADDLYPYLLKVAEALPANFHKTFCLTGLSNSAVFTARGFKLGRTLEFGIPENCASLPDDFLTTNKPDLVDVNGEQVDVLMGIVRGLVVPLVPGRPADVPPAAPVAPAAPGGVYTGKEKLEEFRPAKQFLPTPQGPRPSPPADNTYVWVGAVIGLTVFLVITR